MIIITGASKGIGKFLFEHFLNDNKESIMGTYNDTEPNSIEQYVNLDITDSENINKFINNYSNELKKLTLINCAGINYNSYGHKSNINEWKKVIEINLIGVFNMIKSLLPIMRKDKFGRIINFSSVVAIKPTPGVSSYAASKSGLWGMAKSLAIENASHNVTINNINLGYSELGMINEVPEEYKSNILKQIPAGIFCNPNDIINTINFLRTTRYITGSSIDLSGGLV